jgi:hypothetical protein
MVNYTCKHMGSFEEFTISKCSMHMQSCVTVHKRIVRLNIAHMEIILRTQLAHEINHKKILLKFIGTAQHTGSLVRITPDHRKHGGEAVVMCFQCEKPILFSPEALHDSIKLRKSYYTAEANFMAFPGVFCVYFWYFMISHLRMLYYRLSPF